MPKPLAVQLYTFRDTTKPGADGLGLDPATLASIAEIGFLGVETVDVPGGDPVAARRALEAAGLQVASSHTWTRLDDLDAFDRASAAVAELGSTSIILSGSGFTSVDVVDAFADRLNAASAVAARHGLSLGFHNHAAEMRPLDGIPVYRRLFARLDPAVVFQVDIFWVEVGGLVPGPVIAELGDRIVSLHVKDGETLPSDAGAEPFVNVAVGQGVIDVVGAVEAANDLPGIGWLIVEFDHCEGSPIKAVADSYEYLVSRGLGRGSAG
jgi:sugar phosphate isomerase/epimerase